MHRIVSLLLVLAAACGPAPIEVDGGAVGGGSAGGDVAADAGSVGGGSAGGDVATDAGSGGGGDAGTGTDAGADAGTADDAGSPLPEMDAGVVRLDAGTAPDAGTLLFAPSTLLTLRAVWANGSALFAGASDRNTIGFTGGGLFRASDAGLEQVAPPKTTAIWGSAANDAWAVGDERFWRWNGTTWSETPTSARGLRALHGTSANDVYAVGENTVMRFDGTAWTNVASSQGFLFAVHAVSPSDVWAAGTRFSHFDGTTWSDFPSPVSTGAQFSGLWASGSNDVWAVGGSTMNGEAIRFDGVSWARSTLPAGTGFLSAIWGAAPNDVWAVGEQLLRFNGTSWSTVPSPVTTSLVSVWGRAANDVWAVGRGGVIIHFDGTSWEQVAPTVREPATRVWAVSATEAWAVGGTKLRHFTNGVWADEALPVSGVSFFGVHGSSSNDVWVTGAQGTVLHRTASGWSTVPSGDSVNLGKVSAVSPNDVWVLGSGEPSTLLHWNGSAFSVVPTGISTRLQALYAANATNVWVGGRDVLARWNGTRFEQAPALGNMWVFDISGTGPNDVWAVGSMWNSIGGSVVRTTNIGRVRRFDGTQWTAFDLAGALDSVWAGPSGAVMGHFDGTVTSIDSTATIQARGLMSLERINALSGAGGSVWGIAGTQLFRFQP
ncbi:MAG: hypothetical protein MUC96_36310 [Myxococcaceae bacterium]|nr:hypothetical protein [Myxococcaceae bacterium]